MKKDISKVLFTQRPISILPDYRPLYRISLIVLILHICGTKSKSSLIKLHLLNWAVSSNKNMISLKKYIQSGYKTRFYFWSIDPALNRALQLAVAEGVCLLEEGKANYQLSKKGIDIYSDLAKEKDLFLVEKEFLKYLGKRTITEDRIKQIVNNRELLYVED